MSIEKCQIRWVVFLSLEHHFTCWIKKIECVNKRPDRRIIVLSTPILKRKLNNVEKRKKNEVYFASSWYFIYIVKLNWIIWIIEDEERNHVSPRTSIYSHIIHGIWLYWQLSFVINVRFRHWNPSFVRFSVLYNHVTFNSSF